MIYKELLQTHISNYLESNKTKYEKYYLQNFEHYDLIQLVEERDRLRSMLQSLQINKPAPLVINLNDILVEYFNKEKIDYENSLEQLKCDASTKMDSRRLEYDKELERLNREANNEVLGLVKKHEELLMYKDKLDKVIDVYDVSPSDLKITEDVSKQELEVLIDTGLKGCKSLEKRQNTKFMTILEDFIDDTGNKDKFMFMFGVICSVFIFSPFVLVYLFYRMYKSAWGLNKALDSLRIAQSVMFNINFDKYVVTPDVIELDVSDIEQSYKETLVELEKKNPDLAIQEEKRYIASNIESIDSDINKANEIVNRLYTSILDVITEGYNNIEETINSIINANKAFGTFINDKPIFNLDFVLGKYKDAIELKVTMQLANIVFNVKAEGMLDFVKLMLCNAILAVKEKCLQVTIYDPDRLGADFSEFFNNKISDYIEVKTKGIETIIDELRTYAQENVKIIGKQNINEYNEQAYAVGKVTRDYKLLILCSDIKKVLESKSILKFMEYSARYGVFVWIIHDFGLSNTIYYDKPFQGIDNPLPVTLELLHSCVSTFIDAVENSKVDSIDYVTGFSDIFIPEQKYWTYSTNKGIGLNFGLENGDPTKGYEIVLGDGNVHALMVGTTGAGKSAAINQMLASLLRKYSPRQLELVMVDFKNVEFAMYVDIETGLSRLPHTKIIAGTKDGEYAISVFDYLLSEMNRRTEIFAKTGVKKLEEYNNKMINSNTEHLCIPRILVLIDEFQVMFTEVDPKSVDKISTAITSLSKLARFCGCHMWFTSQSMKGTLSKDILDQFSLRVALRCSKDISTSIIGSPQAGTIKTKFGYLYTNTSGGEEQSSTTLWRVPFASNKVLEDTLVILNDLNIKYGYTNQPAVFYNEKNLHYASDLFSFYADNDGLVSKPRLFILGERTGFSLNKAPHNFNMTIEDGEHILLYAFERVDLMNLVMTFVDNINMRDNVKMIIHSADKDTHILLGVEDLVEESLVTMSLPSFEFESWIEALEGMVDARKERNSKELVPIYFIAIQWEKYKGFGREEVYKLTDRFKRVLQACSLVDIHFIFACRIAKEIPSSLHSLCNHKIAAKCDEQTSYKFLDNARASKLPESLGFAIYAYGSTQYKFKIYQHEFTRTLEGREIVL
ncbi:MAG: hypothetical protein LBS29_04890 [Endomicrobium sp.]|jgi:hypothetical protein|nr:hypothetical protein [Endomicrobium sp.]